MSNRRGIFMKKKVWPQVDAYAAGAPGRACAPSRNALGPRRPTGCAGVGQPGSRGWFINGWVWNGLRQPVLWMTAGIVVGAQPRFRLRVSTRLLFVRLEKLLFYKGIFFQCPVFSSSTWTALSWSVDGLVLPLVVVINDDDGYKV